MRGADEAVSVVSAEVHIRKGCRTEFVSPMPDVVMAQNFVKTHADYCGRRDSVLVKLAVTEHNLVTIAEVLVDPNRARSLVGPGSSGEEVLFDPVDRAKVPRDDGVV